MGMWSRFRTTLRGERHAAEIREELEFHLHMDQAGGNDPDYARRRLGNLTRIEEDTRAMGVVEWLDSAFQDARYGIRQIWKSPVLALAVVLSLTLGIGANSAIFNLVDAAILKPLPVLQPQNLRIVDWRCARYPEGVESIGGNYEEGAHGNVRASSISASLYRTLAARQVAYATLIGAGDPDPVAIATGSAPADQVDIQYVSTNFFEGLGVSPALGRSFLATEDRVGQEPVVVVSHRFWASNLGRRPDVLGRFIRINNVPARIVGIAPAGFFGTQIGHWTDVYSPLSSQIAFTPSDGSASPLGENDRLWWVRLIARVKPGTAETASLALLNSQFQPLVTPPGDTLSDKIPQLLSSPGAHGFEALESRESGALWTLMVLVGVLLLVVCANVANLLLSRSVGRQRESAVRLAMGASRLRLFRQHLIESSIFAFAGGAAGMFFGDLLARSLHLLYQTGRNATNAYDLDPDPRVLAYTAAISIFTALLFGLAPAFRSARTNLGDALKANSRSVARGRLGLPRVLVSVQIALSLAALVAAGLLVRSLSNLTRVDVGFDRQNLAYASLSPARAGYNTKQITSYIDRLNTELRRLPGVASVSVVRIRPLSGNGNFNRVVTPETAPNIKTQTMAEAYLACSNLVDDRFFETMRIPILAGRALDSRDLNTESPAVAVVDQAFAEKFFPGRNPIGLRFGFRPDQPARVEIVGLVGRTRYSTLRETAYPVFYQPYRVGGTVHFAIRSSIDSARLVPAVRKAVAAIDPAIPLTEFQTQTGLIDRLLRTERLLGFVSTAFGVLALVLAAVGLAGLLAYAIARRTNEIGLRMALGASSADVVRMVLRDSLWMVASGVLLGLPCAYAIGQFLKSALFQLKPMDVSTAVGAFAGLLLVALIAAWVPARRASRIDPIIALREE